MVPRDVTAPPRRRSRVIQRRRRTFERLLALAALTFVLGFVPALSWVWIIHLVADAGLGLYVWRLIRLKHVPEPLPVLEASPAAYDGDTYVSEPDEAPAYVVLPEQPRRLVKTG